jgi:hypothetical protein
LGNFKGEVLEEALPDLKETFDLLGDADGLLMAADALSDHPAAQERALTLAGETGDSTARKEAATKILLFLLQTLPRGTPLDDGQLRRRDRALQWARLEAVGDRSMAELLVSALIHPRLWPGERPSLHLDEAIAVARSLPVPKGLVPVGRAFLARADARRQCGDLSPAEQDVSRAAAAFEEARRQKVEGASEGLLEVKTKQGRPASELHSLMVEVALEHENRGRLEEARTLMETAYQAGNRQAALWVKERKGH